jgi:hypothetical protein
VSDYPLSTHGQMTDELSTTEDTEDTGAQS